MKSLKNLKFLLSVISASVVLITSCAKVKNPVPMGAAGQTLVKFIDGGTLSDPGTKSVSIELTAAPQIFDAFDLRRDIPNNAELDKGMTVVIKNDPGVATAVSSDLVGLPDGSFTLSGNVAVVGDEFQITLAPGQFAAQVKLTLLDASTLDATKSYAAGFTIASADADGKVLDAQKSFVVVFSSKNRWDGEYRLYGSFFRSDLPDYVGVSNSPAGYYEPYALITSGSSSVDATINTTNYGVTNTQIIYVVGGGYTYFTAVAPRLNIDPFTNLVTVTPGVAATPPSVNFTQNTAELADSKFYPAGISGVPASEGRQTIVAHFKWTSGDGRSNSKRYFCLSEAEIALRNKYRHILNSTFDIRLKVSIKLLLFPQSGALFLSL